MTDVTAGEVAALRTALAGKPERRPGAHGRPTIRRYDFRVPDKFPKDILRQIQHIHDTMARTLTTALSALLRAPVRVEDATAEQRAYEEFVGEAADPAILAAFSVEPLQGNAILEIDPFIAFPMIDRLLGGSGEGAALDRPTTEIELTIIRRVLVAILDIWADAWSHISELHAKILGVETNPLFTQLAGPTEIVLVVSVVCGLARREGRLRLCFPYTMIEPLVHRLAARQWVATATEAPGSRQTDLLRELDSVPVAVSVEIARLRLSLDRLVALRPGEVLPLGASLSTPVRVCVRGSAKFSGQVGRDAGHLAVRIGQAEGGA